MADERSLLIGEAARRAGLNPKTLRFYEEVGLVAPVGRTPKGYRLFDDQVVVRLAFIKKAQALGFTLAETKEILELRDGGEMPCGHVEHQVAEKLLAIEDKITELKSLEVSLLALLERPTRADEGHGAVCPRIEGS